MLKKGKSVKEARETAKFNNGFLFINGCHHYVAEILSIRPKTLINQQSILFTLEIMETHNNRERVVHVCFTCCVMRARFSRKLHIDVSMGF